MNAEIVNACLLVISWLVGLSCSLSMYVKGIYDGYKAIGRAKKSYLCMATLEVLFGCFINVLVNYVSTEIEYPTDFVSIFFGSIVCVFETFIVLYLITRTEPQFIVAFQTVLFVAIAVGLRYFGVFLITKFLETKNDVSISRIMEGIIWCFLIEQLVVIVEKKFRVIKVEISNEKSFGSR